MAVGYSRTARDIAFTLEVKSPKIFENIFLNNGVLVLLGSKGRVRIVKGGNRFDERTHLGQNSNVDHRDRYAVIDNDFQNNWRTASYGRAVIDGASPVNFIDADENMGSHQIGTTTLAEEVLEDLMNTFPNKVADALMASTSGANGPLSIVEELPATAFGSQTRTTGGLVRSDWPGPDRTQAWQTQYSNTGADLAGAGGIGTATAFGLTCSEGSSLDMQPDILLTTNAVFSQASAAADVLRRFGVNDTLLKFRFDNIKIGNAALITDRNVGSKKGYFLNTNFMRVQVLGGRKTKASRSVKVVGDGATSVPLQVGEPVEAENRLQYTIKAWLTYNLTFGALKYHGLMDNLTEVSE